MRPGRQAVRAQKTLARCAFETLERRTLMAADPALYVGPLPESNDPSTHRTAPGAGPSSELLASTLTQSGTGSYTFKVVYRDFEGVLASSIDSYDIYVYGPNGYSRRATLMSIDPGADGPLVSARYKVAAPGSWSFSKNGRYQVVLQPGQVTDIHGVPAWDGIVGEFQVLIPGSGAGPTTPIPAVQGISIVDFGAIPGDGRDDTVAIQAAMDFLHFGSGAAGGSNILGGTVLIPAGVWDLTGTLRVRSGITLRGTGPNSVLHHIGTDRTKYAIQFYSPYTHRWNVNPTIENLTLYTRWAGGINIDPNMNGDLLDFRLANLRISSLGPAIDLRNEAPYYGEIDNVEVYNPGSTALYLGRVDGHGAADRVRNFRVTGVARSGFRAEQGLVIIKAEALIEGMTISTTGANVVPLYVGGFSSYTFTDINLQVPAANCPGGVAMLFENARHIGITTVNNIGTNRKIKLRGAYDVQITHVKTDGTTSLFSNIAVVDLQSYLRIGNNVNGSIANTAPPAAPVDSHVRAPLPTRIIDATNFGVIPFDGIDDTAALQAAIDSLPRGNGIPGGTQDIGGIVQLPYGTITLTAPLRIPSGVWLKGFGQGATVFLNDVTPADRAAVEFYSPFTHGSNIGAGIDGVGIWTRFAAGVKTDSTVRGELLDLTLRNMRINTWGVGVDFRNVTVKHLLIDAVVFQSPGTTAIWVGKTDNSSSNNIIRGIRMNSIARFGFAPEKALWVFHGQNTLQGGSLEDTLPPTSVLPFYASGNITISGLYSEFPEQDHGLEFVFENCPTVRIDWLTFVNPMRRLSFINCPDARMTSLNIDGTTAFLRDTIAVDGASKFTIGSVIGQWDSGMLDHPRVIVQGFYNKNAAHFVETKIANGTPNLVKDPNFTSVGDDIWNVKDWHIVWGDSQQSLGTFAVETVNGVKRLRIDVPDEMYLAVRIRLNLPASAVGKYAVGRWRIDGPTAGYMYLKEWASELMGHAPKSMTAARTNIPLRSGDEMWVSIPNAKGTYYISKVGLVSV